MRRIFEHAREIMTSRFDPQTGRWDFRVQWTPDESQFGGMAPAPSGSPNALPGLFTAIQEQVGLKLELVKTLAEVLVVDHVEKPSAN